MKLKPDPDPDPFPWRVLDDRFPAHLLAEAHRLWPSEDWPGWVRYGPEHGGPGKRASDLATPVPAVCAELLSEMARLNVNERFGTGALPDLGLWGAGLHQLDPGAELPLHLDAQRHGRLGLWRLLTATLYVHPRWQDDWGGNLELWRSPQERVQSIPPQPGRLVVFASAWNAYHAVSRVIGPEPRRSLSLFWYGLPCPEEYRSRALFLTDREPGA